MIQSEWIFIRHITHNMIDALVGVEKMLWETFLYCLFFRKSKTLSPKVGILSTTPVKKSELGLMNPMTSSNDKYLIFQSVSTELIQAVIVEGEFYNADHLLALS